MYNDSHLDSFDRAGKVTASLAGAILGMDPYTSRKEAWRRITGRAKPAQANMHIQRGLDHEKDALEWFEAETGIILKPGLFIPHPKHKWLGASPDAITLEWHPVEAKCPQYVHTEIPQQYYAQVQIQITCLNARLGWFVSWTEQEKMFKPVHIDEKWFDDYFEELEFFYNEYVVKDTEPPRMKRRM